VESLLYAAPAAGTTPYGAIGAIAPSSVDFYSEQDFFAQEVMQRLGDVGFRPQTQGELFYQARASYLAKYPEFLRTAREYHLFGDPSADLTLPLGTSVEDWSLFEK